MDAAHALLGLFNAVLLATLLLPFLLAFSVVAQGADQATAPRWAAAFADQMAYLYPPVHREALRHPGQVLTPAEPAPAEDDAAGK